MLAVCLFPISSPLPFMWTNPSSKLPVSEACLLLGFLLLLLHLLSTLPFSRSWEAPPIVTFCLLQNSSASHSTAITLFHFHIHVWKCPLLYDEISICLTQYEWEKKPRKTEAEFGKRNRTRLRCLLAHKQSCNSSQSSWVTFQLLMINSRLCNTDTYQGARPYSYRPRCQLCPHIYLGNKGPNNIRKWKGVSSGVQQCSPPLWLSCGSSFRVAFWPFR